MARSVTEVISDDPKTSIRMMSAQLNVPKSTIHRIVKLELGHPYKLQIKHRLCPTTGVCSLDARRASETSLPSGLDLVLRSGSWMDM